MRTAKFGGMRARSSRNSPQFKQL